MFQDLLTDLPVPPELIAAGIGILIVIVLLRWAAAALGRRVRALVAAHRARAATEAEPVPTVPEDAAADEELPGILYPMPVVSQAETRILHALEAVIRDSGPGHRVMMQLSLNAFLFGCAAGRARRADPASTRQLAALSVDFLIVDTEWRPVLAVDVERGEFSAAPIEERTTQALARAGIAHMVVGAEGPSEPQRAEMNRHLGYAQGVAAE